MIFALGQVAMSSWGEGDGGWIGREPRRASRSVLVKGVPVAEEQLGVLGCVPGGAVADVGEPKDAVVASVAEGGL